MAVGGLDRKRLALAVKRERTRRGLSVREAARQAPVDRGTWAGVEDGSRLPQDAKAALMEQVIGMGPGSFDAILAGGGPTPIQADKTALTEEQQDLMRTYRTYIRKHGPDEAKALLRRDVDKINEIQERTEAG